MLITSRGFLDAGSLGRLPTKDGGTVNFGSKEREAVMGDEGVLGRTEHWKTPPSITVTIADSTEVDKKAIAEFVDQTIVLNTNNGQTFTLTGAWVHNPQELKIKDGELEVTFYGYEML